MTEPELIDGRLVVIKPFVRTDINDAYIGWLNDPEVVRFSNQRFRRHDRASSEAFFASFVGSPNLFLSIRRRGDDAAIGTMTVYRNLHHGTADVGIMVGDGAARGCGFGQDAWNAMIGWLLGPGQQRKVTAGTLACNAGMVRVLERSGMTLEGVRRGQELIDGTPQDIVLYGKFP